MLATNTIDSISQQLFDGRETFLIFDRDGTLVPLVEDPALAVLDSSIRNSLDRLSSQKGLHVCIMSARSIAELRCDLPDGRQILAGNYGLEIEIPGTTRYCHPQAQSARPDLEKAKALLVEKLPTAFKPILEDHGLSLCLHFHRTPDSLLRAFHAIVREVAGSVPDLYFKSLPTSYEVWPVTDWDKSDGLAKMMQIAGFSPEKVTLLYAGDSHCDEPAFAWINARRGISIHVGKRESEARFVLETPAALHKLIQRLEMQALQR